MLAYFTELKLIDDRYTNGYMKLI